MVEFDNTTCAVHTEQIEQLKKDTGEQWTAINEIRTFMRKLVPVWVTVVLMASSFITGSALTFAGMIIKFAQGN